MDQRMQETGGHIALLTCHLRQESDAICGNNHVPSAKTPARREAERPHLSWHRLALDPLIRLPGRGCRCGERTRELQGAAPHVWAAGPAEAEAVPGLCRMVPLLRKGVIRNSQDLYQTLLLPEPGIIGDQLTLLLQG